MRLLNKEIDPLYIGDKNPLINGFSIHEDLLLGLLQDHTTGTNILNTETYKPYTEFPILIPRYIRGMEQNKARSKSMAEVFTPINVVKQMNDVIIEECKQSYKSMDEYIDSTQLEITCGEGVFLATRYNSETGDYIDLCNRVGLLDFKLQYLCKEVKDKDLFLNYLVRVAKSMYGYEYQGDSLLMSRLNVLYSFIEYYCFTFKEFLPYYCLYDLVVIITWNIFQMDGLTMCIPQKDVVRTKDKSYKAVNGVPVKINNWKENRIYYFNIDLN